jgi:hypothetical protein
MIYVSKPSRGAAEWNTMERTPLPHVGPLYPPYLNTGGFNHLPNGKPMEGIPRMFIEAKNYLIGWLTGAPFIPVI